MSLKLNPTTGKFDVVRGINPLKVGAVQFDIAHTPLTNAEGLLQWNSTDGTLDLGMSGGDITQQIGQELFTKVRNEPGYQTISNGQVVYISGRTGVYPSVRLARSDADATSRVLGVATQDIASPAFGYITTVGYVRGIKTDYIGTGIWGTTWITGDLLYVSKTDAGVLTNVEPAAPHHSDTIGTVGVISATQGSILITLDRHKTLSELSDVDGTPLATTGQIPVWNQTAGYFDFNYNLLSLPAGTVPISALANASAQYKFPVSGATPFAYAESAGALNITAAKTLAVTQTMTLASFADGSLYAFPAASGTVATLNTQNIFTTFQTIIQNSNAQNNSIRLINTNNGNNAQSRFVIFNDGGQGLTDGFAIFMASSGWTAPFGNSVGFWNYENGPFIFSTNNTIRMFIAAAGNVLIGNGTTASTKLHISNDTSATNTVVDVLTIEQTSTGTAANNLGVSVLFKIETATASTIQSAARWYAQAINNTNATRLYDLVGTVYDFNGEREGIRISADGVGALVNLKGGQVRPYVAKTADYTLTRNDYVCDVTANNVNITLPTAVGFTGQIYQINNSGTGIVTMLTTSSELICTNASGVIKLNQCENLTVMSTGSSWIIIY